MPDDSLTGNLGQSRRRKMRNLRDSELLLGGAVVPGGPIDPDDPGGPTDGPVDPGGPGDCDGGLMGCEELAKGPFCSPDSSGAYEEQVGCVVDVATANLSPGDTVAWGADLKLTSGTEVNPSGTLKMTDSGLLYRDALDTLDGVTVENGTAEILNGKLHLPDGSNNDVRFTGATTRNEVVAQIRVQGSMNPSGWTLARFAARATGTLDAYVGMYSKFQDALDRFVGGAFDAQLDVENYAGGAQRLSGERTVIKLYTADGVQKLKMSTDVDDQTYQMSATDTDLDSDTGVPALISQSSNHPTIAWDLIQCPNDEITCSSLPTDYSIRVGALAAQESSGTATLDLEGTLYPSAFPLEILDDNGDVVEAWMPDAGFFGGATFEYSSGGSFSADDVAGQIDLDIFDASGTLLQTAETGSTWDQPTWKRFSGTVQLPEGSAYLAPTMRRTGSDSGIFCVRLVVLRAGTAAPWVPCEDPASAAIGGCRGGGETVIINGDWTAYPDHPGFASHWGRESGGTGTIDVDTPSLAFIDFSFAQDGGIETIYQVASNRDDIGQPNTPVRFFPVCPDDFITFAGEFVKENPGDSTGATLIIREYDADFNQIGTAHSGPVAWVQSDEGSRRQTIWRPGREVAFDFAEQVRYMSFAIQVIGDAGETCGLNYMWGWLNPPDFKLSGFVDIDGTDADFHWTSQIPCRVKYVANTTGFLTREDMESSGSFSFGSNREEQTVANVQTGLSSGETVYVSAAGFDQVAWRRSSRMLWLKATVP